LQKLSNPLSIRHEESLPIVTLFLVLALPADSGLRHCTFRGLTESDIRLMKRDWKLIGGRRKR
jgi:hypothetical protein